MSGKLLVSSYTCPRCGVGYCSAKCYKAHSTACTEGFFKDRVIDERDFERKESGDEGRMKQVRVP